MEIKVRDAFVLTRRVDLHAIDATPARWRSDAGFSPLDGASTAASSSRHPTHWLISTQAPKTLKTNLVKLAKNNGAELGFLS